MPRMQSKIPARKVVASSIGTALGVLVIYILETMFSLDIPTGVQGAIYTLTSFALGYITPPASIDQIEVAVEA
ncbi:hypothetical protein [Yoonia sp. R2-816]|uniref:hypothetical protein n=1 Tax=Yoonia sp. R2-816 TaxID=3342638 RepID=UPI003729485A